jgi:hypothetical protein
MIKKYSDRRFPRTASIATACLASLAAIAMTSCARKADQPSQRTSGGAPIESASPQAAPTSAGGFLAPAVQGMSARAQAAAAPKPAPPLAAGLRAFGLGARPRPRMPEDFSLGPLQSLRPDTKEERAALATALAFLDGVAAGKADPSLYLPEARDALAALLAPQPAKDGTKASGARVGAIELEGGAASLRVRLPSREGGARLEGLLSLREEGGAWYVEALALDPPSSAELAFDPGARQPSR